VKGLLITLLAILGTGILLVCSCARDDSASVVFWQFQPPDLMEDLIEEFERQNPSIDVRVETLTWQSGYEKIVMAFSAGRLPDLLEVGSTWLPTFQAKGVIEDLTAETAGLEDELMMWDLATSGGRRYGIPWLIGSRVLFYNRELFSRAGLSPDSPPVTWSEFASAAKAVHNPDQGIYGFGMNAGERYVLYKKFMPFAWGNGGRILSEDLTECRLNSAENLEALEFYLSLKTFSILERQDMIDDMFKQGRIGMMVSGGWNLRRIPEDAPDLDFGVTFIPRPDDGGVHASFAGAEILVLPVGSRRDPALKLARFLVDAENALKISSELKGVQPASKRALDHSYYDGHPMERLLLEQCKTSFSPPPSPLWVEIEEVINTRLEECLYGNITPEEALALMEEDVNGIIRP
jgi:multiple sugar transport system substrate-binding protein